MSVPVYMRRTGRICPAEIATQGSRTSYFADRSPGVVGPALLGSRLRRNARFVSIGNGIGATLMGACGYYVSEQAVFFLTAAVTLPAIVCLLPLARLRDPAHIESGRGLGSLEVAGFWSL